MSSITDVGPVPATRTRGGAVRQDRKPRGTLTIGILAWLIGILFIVPVVWMVQWLHSSRVVRCTHRAPSDSDLSDLSLSSGV